MATGEGLRIDVDQTFDAKGTLTLDEHRQAEFAKLNQAGFGEQPKADQVKADE